MCTAAVLVCLHHQTYDARTECISMLIELSAGFVSNKRRWGEFPSIEQKNMGVADKSTTPRGWPAKHGGLGGMGMAGRIINAARHTWFLRLAHFFQIF